jgi:hypothetical protein
MRGSMDTVAAWFAGGADGRHKFAPPLRIGGS